MKKVIALCGSLSSRSVNLQVIEDIRRMAKGKFNVAIYNDLGQLPHFNPDIDNDEPPKRVRRFRKKLREADGVLVCTPEYAMGVPGALKNAFDWLVSSMELTNKPTALVTASTSGEKAHASLLGTLKVIEADVADDTALLISFIKAKMDVEGMIKDGDTREKLELLINAFEVKLKK